MAIWSNIRRLNERAKDALWAGIAALLLAFFGLLGPLDQFAWMYQALLGNDEMSGEIVFGSSKESLSDPATPLQRLALARSLDQLAESEVEHVYVDVIFDRPSNAAADQALSQAIARMGSRVSMVRRLVSSSTGAPEFERSIPLVTGEADQIASAREINYLGFTWSMPREIALGGVTYPTLSAQLSGVRSAKPGPYPISYGFDAATLPTIKIDRPLPEEELQDLRGKVLVIGNPPITDSDAANIPGLPRVPSSFILIYAAESQKAGYTREFRAELLLALVLACFGAGLAAAGSRRKARMRLYAFAVMLLPILFVLGAAFHTRFSLGGIVVFLLWYAGLRFRSRWQKRFALEDEKTGMPTFRAFEKDILEEGAPAAVIVAKVHGYEDVVKTLPPELHGNYVLSLVERFKVTESELKIYANEGRYFVWGSSQLAPEEIEGHLDGLRALFAAPITVDGTELDAAITFGVDMSDEPNPAQRIASAVSAAENTDEAHRPIIFAEHDSHSDALWKLSLQTRIDNALEREEIYLVYQPKVDIITGEMVGVEALVRWNDPSRGLISPAFFIQECERAGRMDHLTEYVLREAVDAAVVLRGHGIDAKMSVNISATSLRDDRVERMVKSVLEASHLPPHLLVLEITETARILDLDHATAVLNRLRDLGIAISIDDFGVGAANLETIYKLPLNEVKIDREFVANIRDPKAAAVVSSIIAFGEATDTTVIAEGAEDNETIELLAERGCRIVQGYGVSRPIAFDELLQFRWQEPRKSKEIMV